MAEIREMAKQEKYQIIGVSMAASIYLIETSAENI